LLLLAPVSLDASEAGKGDGAVVANLEFAAEVHALIAGLQQGSGGGVRASGTAAGHVYQLEECDLEPVADAQRGLRLRSRRADIRPDLGPCRLCLRREDFAGQRHVADGRDEACCDQGTCEGDLGHGAAPFMSVTLIAKSPCHRSRKARWN
jgi:hypothetical protein